MTITEGNRLGETLTLGIKDQHGLAMTDAKFYVDGMDYADFWATTDDGNFLVDDVWTAPVAVVDTEVAGKTYNDAKHIIEVRSADDSIISHNTIELFGPTTWNYTKAQETSSTTVYNEAQLKKAFTAGKADTVTLGKDIKLNGALTVDVDDKLVVPAEYTLDLDDETLTVDGELEISGEVKGGVGSVLTGTGTATVKAGGSVAVETVNMTVDDSLHIESGATVAVKDLGGYVYTSDDLVVDAVKNNTVITMLEDGLDISATTGGIPTFGTGAKIAIAAESEDEAVSMTLGGGLVTQDAGTYDSTTGAFVITGANATEAAADSKLDELEITNPTTLTASQYATARVGDTGADKVKADLKAVIEAKVAKELGAYNASTHAWTVAIEEWTPSIAAGDSKIAATDSASYKVSVTLAGETVTDEEATTLTFTNLPTGV